jgi:hypothetical protein
LELLNVLASRGAGRIRDAICCSASSGKGKRFQGGEAQSDSHRETSKGGVTAANSGAWLKFKSGGKKDRGVFRGAKQQTVRAEA